MFILATREGTIPQDARLSQMTQEKPLAPVPANRARQGVISGRVLTVLVISITLTIIGFGLAYIYA